MIDASSYSDFARFAINEGDKAKMKGRRLYELMLLSNLAARAAAVTGRKEPFIDQIMDSADKATIRLDSAFNFFDYTFEEALAFFRKKNLMTAEDFQRLEGIYKGYVFGTKSTMGLEDSLQYSVLDTMKKALDKAIQDGTTFEQFRKDMDGVLDASKARLQLIYRQQTLQAYSAGNWEQLYSDPADDYLIYKTAGDSRVRPAHAAWNNFTAKKSDPTWQTVWVPADYNCRCNIRVAFPSEMASANTTRPSLSTIPKDFRGNPGDGFVLDLPTSNDLNNVIASLGDM